MIALYIFMAVLAICLIGAAISFIGAIILVLEILKEEEQLEEEEEDDT
jgi:uncharacterized membrane protein